MASGNPASRLSVKHGKLSLCYPMLPELGCLLLALDEHGCRGAVLYKYVSAETVAKWKKTIAPKRPLHIKLEIQPWLRAFEADVLVQDVLEAPDQTEVEMVFNQLPPEQRMRLHHTVLAMAMQKIRKETQVAPALAPDGMDLVEIPQVPQPQAAVQPVAAPAALVTEPPPAPADRPVEPEPAPAIAPQIMRAAVTMPAAAPAQRGDTSTLFKLKRVGEVLIHMGQLKPDQLEKALAGARTSGEKIGRYLVRTGLVAPDVLCRALALQSGLPVTDLAEAEVPDKLARAFGPVLMVKHAFVPFDEAHSFVCIAVATPLKTAVVQELEKCCNKKVEVFLAQEEMVLKLIDGLQLKQQKKLRKHIRYDIPLPVQYQFCSRLGTPAEAVQHPGTSINISEGGMLLEGTPSALGKPEDLRRRGMCVRITFGPTGSEIAAICQLRAIREKERKAAENPRWLLGLEFVEITADQRRRLKEICVQAVREAPKSSPERKPFEN